MSGSDLSPEELAREHAELVGVVRMFLWVHTQASLGAYGSVAPVDAFAGRVLTEYQRAVLLASRWSRKAGS